MVNSRLIGGEEKELLNLFGSVVVFLDRCGKACGSGKLNIVSFRYFCLPIVMSIVIYRYRLIPPIWIRIWIPCSMSGEDHPRIINSTISTLVIILFHSITNNRVEV